MSRRFLAVRRIVYASGDFSAGVDGTGMVVAALASAPNVALRPDAAWRTRDCCARHSEAGTPNVAAAAAISISFAEAPATRMPYTPVPRTAVDPPVVMKPSRRVTRYVP